MTSRSLLAVVFALGCSGCADPGLLTPSPVTAKQTVVIPAPSVPVPVLPDPACLDGCSIPGPIIVDPACPVGCSMPGPVIEDPVCPAGCFMPGPIIVDPVCKNYGVQTCEPAVTTIQIQRRA